MLLLMCMVKGTWMVLVFVVDVHGSSGLQTANI